MQNSTFWGGKNCEGESKKPTAGTLKTVLPAILNWAMLGCDLQNSLSSVMTYCLVYDVFIIYLILNLHNI